MSYQDIYRLGQNVGPLCRCLKCLNQSAPFLVYFMLLCSEPVKQRCNRFSLQKIKQSYLPTYFHHVSFACC